MACGIHHIAGATNVVTPAIALTADLQLGGCTTHQQLSLDRPHAIHGIKGPTIV